MPPPINPLNPPPQDERNLRKLLTEGLGSGGEDVEIGNVLRRGGKRGPMGADATFRGKIRPDQPGLRYNLLLIADADRGGQPRFVNLDTLRWVKALQRMARPWGDPQASHNTIPREERRYAKDATYTTSGGNLGVRHFYPAGYGPLDDEDAPESRQPKAPISELRGPAGRERFAKWLTEGGIGTRTRDFSEGENMDGLGAQFAAPGRGMLNDGGRWSRGRFMPKGAAERLAQSLGVMRIPMGQGFSLTGGAADRSPGAVNHFMPGRRQQFALGEQQFGIRSIPPTADAYLDRLKAWRAPGGDVEPPDMPEREELENIEGISPQGVKKQFTRRDINEMHKTFGSGKMGQSYDLLKVRLGRVPHGGLDYDPSEMSDRVPTDAEKREIVGPNVMDTRMARIPSNLPPHVREMLSQYELERNGAKELERHNLRYPNHPAQQEASVNVPGSATDLRTRLLEMELNDPSIPHELLAKNQNERPVEDAEWASSGSHSFRITHALIEALKDRNVRDEVSEMTHAKHGGLQNQDLNDVLAAVGRRNIARHRFSIGSQDFALRPQPQLGALGHAQLVPIMLPQGQAPAVGVTPTGGYAPPPQNAALIPARRFALGEQDFSILRPDETGKGRGLGSAYPRVSTGRYGETNVEYDPKIRSIDHASRQISNDEEPNVHEPWRRVGNGEKITNSILNRILEGMEHIGPERYVAAGYDPEDKAVGYVRHNVMGWDGPLSAAGIRRPGRGPGRGGGPRFSLGEQEMGGMPGLGFALRGTAFAPRYDSLTKTVSPPRQAAWQDPGGYKPPTLDASKTSPYTSNQSRLRFSRDQNQSLDDIIAGLGNDQPLSDEPWVEELTPQELAIQRTMTNIGRGKNKTPYEMNIADWAAQMANRRASGAANGPQQKARERLGHSSNMRAVIDAHQQQQGQQPIVPIPTQPQEPQETPEQRRRRMSGRMLYSASGQSFRLDPNDERERRRQSEVDNWQRVQEMMARRAYIAGLPDTRYLPRPQLGAPDEPPTRYHPQMAHKSGYEAPRATASSNLTPEMIVAMLMNRRQRSSSLGEEIPREAGLGMPDEMPRHRSSSGDQEVYLERNPVRGFGGPDHHSYLIARNQPELQMDRVEQLDYTPASGGELDSLAGLHALSSGGAEPAQRPAAFAPRQVQQHQPDYGQSRAPRYPRQPEKPKAAIPWYGAFDPPRLENQPTQQAPRLGMNPIMAAPAARIAPPSVQQRTPSQERAEERDVELSPEQAKIFIQEINKRQKGRGPGAVDRAAESASRAEGLRFGPRARFELGEQDFGLLDTIKHIGSMVNPVTNYRNLREGGHGRLASGAMVGGGLLGDAMLTGFHPPLVSLGLGRYAQGRAQAADRASDERRAEWMRG